MTTAPADCVTLNRSDLAALLAHHADVIAARWRAVAPGAGAWEVAGALSLTSHANELTAEAEEETPAVAELLDSIMSFNAEQQPAAVPSVPADADLRERYEAEASPWYEVINPRNATTSIALVHDDGELYLPEGPDALTVEEFHFAAARGKAYRLMRVDEAMAVADAELRRMADEAKQAEHTPEPS